MLRARRSRKQSASGTEAISLSQQISSMSVEQLKNKPFTLISFQYAVACRGQYYPCELGAVQFSLSRGVHKAYHTFISPKPLPQGTFAEAKHHADESHQLPFLTDFPHWNEDFKSIADNLGSMMSESDRVFSNSVGDELKITTGSLEYLDMKTRSGISDVSVFPVDRLVENIARRFNVCLSSADEIEKYLGRSVHDFDPNVRCFYHEEQDGQHCAYATVFRLFFNLMDFMNERGIIRVDPATLKVPECFISRYRSHGPTFRYGQKEPAQPSSNAEIWNFKNWNEASDLCSCQHLPAPIEDDSGSDTTTVVNVSMSQSEVSNPVVYGSASAWVSAENNDEQRLAAESSVSQQLSQTKQSRMPVVEVIMSGPPRHHILPKKIFGLTVEPLGDQPLVFLSEAETD